MTTVQFIFSPRKELLEYLNNGLAELNGLNLVIPTEEEANAKIFDQVESADIILGWRPTLDLLKKAKNTKLYINPGAGVQHLVPLFKQAFPNNDVVLVNGHGNSYFTAQHAVALLLALSNKVIPHHQWLEQGKWRTGDKEGASIPLRDRKLGLLGYGNINQKVHRFLSGFELEFHVLKRDWSMASKAEHLEYKSYEPKQLHSFLSAVDTLVVAMPLTAKTEGLIGRKELELLGGEALLVNVGRGAIFDQVAFFAALKQKMIAGAAIDVWYNNEPQADDRGKLYPYDQPFHELDNVVLSPHRAASPFVDLKRWDEVIENISRFHRGERSMLNVVSLEEGY